MTNDELRTLELGDKIFFSLKLFKKWDQPDNEYGPNHWGRPFFNRVLTVNETTKVDTS